MALSGFDIEVLLCHCDVIEFISTANVLQRSLVLIIGMCRAFFRILDVSGLTGTLVSLKSSLMILFFADERNNLNEISLDLFFICLKFSYP